MRTKKIFEENVYLKEIKASILDISEDDNQYKIILDKTIFFPTGGGQSCDIGTIGNYKVIKTEIENDEIYHYVEKIEGSKDKLSINDELEIAIDWEHRFNNMQRHCGEHLLSGIFHREFGAVNRGFHMGEDYMTIDMSLEEEATVDKIDWDMAKKVELIANRVVSENVPVYTNLFETREEAEKAPLRKALAFDEDISIVYIGREDNIYDCVACCGTHPSSTGQIGLIKVYKVEPNKGMFRIYFEAGERAFKKYQEEYDVLTTMGKKLSAGTDDLLDKYQATVEKNKAVRNELFQLKKLLISMEIEKIEKNLESKDIKGVNVEIYETLSIDDILNIGRALIGKIPEIQYLIHKPSNTLLLFSNGKGKYNCGKLVKENASIYNGKGGGNDNSSRAIFPKYEYIETFIDLLEKHLR